MALDGEALPAVAAKLYSRRTGDTPLLVGVGSISCDLAGLEAFRPALLTPLKASVCSVHLFRRAFISTQS